MPDGRPATLAAVAMVLLTACADGSPTTGAAAPSAPPPSAGTAGPERPPGTGTIDDDRLIAGLCTAAGSDDVEDASRRFMNAHHQLHDLARDAAGSDRQVAARLHEAKRRTETVLGAEDADGLGQSFEQLIEAARAALQTIGRPVPGCDGRSPAG